jgi:hypothetical protein
MLRQSFTLTVETPDECVMRAAVRLSAAASPRPGSRQPTLSADRLVGVPVDSVTARIAQAFRLAFGDVQGRYIDTVANVTVWIRQPLFEASCQRNVSL